MVLNSAKIDIAKLSKIKGLLDSPQIYRNKKYTRIQMIAWGIVIGINVVLFTTFIHYVLAKIAIEPRSSALSSLIELYVTISAVTLIYTLAQDAKYDIIGAYLISSIILVWIRSNVLHKLLDLPENQEDVTIQ